MKTIEIKCTGSRTVKVQDLLNFQGDLKKINDTNFNKLKQSILHQGFSAPIFVWTDKGGNQHIIDGHSRKKVLLTLLKEQYVIPEIPVVDIEADSVKQAKMKLLLITSQYGEFDLNELEAFVDSKEMMDLLRLVDTEILFNEEDLDISDFFMNSEEQTYKKEKVEEHAFMTCPDCGYKFEI